MVVVHVSVQCHLRVAGYRRAAGVSNSRDRVGDLAQGDGPAENGGPFAVGEVVDVGDAADDDDRHADFQEALDERHGLAFDVDDDDAGRAPRQGVDGVAHGLVADGVEAALDQLRAEQRARPVLGADDPDDGP